MLRFLLLLPFFVPSAFASNGDIKTNKQIDFSPLFSETTSPWVSEFRQRKGDASFEIDDEVFDELLQNLSCNEIGYLITTGDMKLLPDRLTKLLEYARDVAPKNSIRAGSILVQALHYTSSLRSGQEESSSCNIMVDILDNISPDQFTSSLFFLQTERLKAYHMWSIMHEPLGRIYLKHRSTHNMAYLRHLLVEPLTVKQPCPGLTNVGEVSKVLLSDIMAMPKGNDKSELMEAIGNRFCMLPKDRDHLPDWLLEAASHDFQTPQDMQIYILSSSQDCCSKKYEQMVTWRLDPNAWKTLVDGYGDICDACITRSKCLAAGMGYRAAMDQTEKVAFLDAILDSFLNPAIEPTNKAIIFDMLYKMDVVAQKGQVSKTADEITRNPELPGYIHALAWGLLARLSPGLCQKSQKNIADIMRDYNSRSTCSFSERSYLIRAMSATGAVPVDSAHADYSKQLDPDNWRLQSK